MPRGSRHSDRFESTVLDVSVTRLPICLGCLVGMEEMDEMGSKLKERCNALSELLAKPPGERRQDDDEIKVIPETEETSMKPERVEDVVCCVGIEGDRRHRAKTSSPFNSLCHSPVIPGLSMPCKI